MFFQNVLWKLAQAWLSSALTQAAMMGTEIGGLRAGVGRGLSALHGMSKLWDGLLTASDFSPTPTNEKSEQGIHAPCILSHTRNVHNYTHVPWILTAHSHPAPLLTPSLQDTL